jgi:hypothetical protein
VTLRVNSIPTPSKQTPVVAAATSVGRSNPDDIVRRGQEAWSRLQSGRSWEDWLSVGEAVQVGRHRAMLEADTNRPRGSRYDSIFGDWLSEAGFDTLDKADRKRLFDCLKHRGEIEAWRQTLPANKRLQLNHPTSVWRNWQKATVAGKATADRTTQLSPISKLKQAVVRLEDENLQLRRAGDDLFSSRDSAADIARLIADRLLQRLSPIKVRQVLEQLSQAVTERAELRREPMSAAPSKRGKKQRRRTVEDFQRDIAAKHKAAEAAS